MNRRLLLQGGAASAILTMISACGGGNDNTGFALPAESVSLGDDGSRDEGYRHSRGIDTLPASPALDLAALALVTPGQTFSVRVYLGDVPQAGVAVSVYDIANVLVEQGVTDNAGLFQATAEGRRFLRATARTPAGELHGFEYNSGTKIGPIVEVNLLPTLQAHLYARLRLAPNALDFVMKRYFGIDYGALLSDVPAESPQIDQDDLQNEFEASGLALTPWLDREVDKIARAIDTGFLGEADATDGSTALFDESQDGATLSATPSVPPRVALFAEPAPESCVVARYDKAIAPDLPSVLAKLIVDNWSVAAKAVLSFAVKKGAALVGQPILGELGNLVLGAILPGGAKPNAELTQALSELNQQLFGLSNSIQEVMRRVNVVHFERTFDSVRHVFNTIDAIQTEIRTTNTFYGPGSGRTVDANYNAVIRLQCEKLFAQETNLIDAYNQFVGLRAMANAGVLNRWMAIVKDPKVQPYYTAIIQRQYTDLLDYYQCWNAQAYAYLVSAYESYASLTATPLNTVRVEQLNERLLKQTENIEKLRPKYLYSERQFIDLANRLTWVGRCGRVDVLDYYPAAVMRGAWGADERRLTEAMRRAPVSSTTPNGCRVTGEPHRDAQIRDDLIKAHAWRLPRVKEVDASFAAVIKPKYGKKFNLETFAYDYMIPASVWFFQGNGAQTGSPVEVVCGGPGLVAGPGRERVIFHADVYKLENLTSSNRLVAVQVIRGRPNPLMSTHYFPVASLTADEVDAYVPWRIYDKVKATLPL